MHMITSTARRPNASTRSEPVERSNFAVHVKTRSLALERSIEQQGRVIDERRWGSGSFAFAGQTAVDHPAAFRWHASSSKKNWPNWCLFPFRMAMVLPLRTAWIADILSQASLRDVERQRCWKRGSGDFGTPFRHDWAIFSSMPLTGEIRRSPEPSARPSAAADSEERQICTTCLFAESVGLCLLQISSNFALARSLSANQGREIAQNRNIDPRDSVVKDLTASRWSKHRDGSWRSRLRGMRYLRTCSEGSKSTCFGHFLLNHLQTRRKPTGHWSVECGKEVVGKTVNSERARTDPVRTNVPGNGRQAPAKRAQTAI